jgi:cytochrome c556
MKNRHILTAFALLVASTGMSSQRAKADTLDPIAVRQAVMSLQGGNASFVRSVVTSKGDVKQLEFSANAIAKSAAVIPSLFPKGTEKGGNTKALPEIWSDPAGFQKLATSLGDAAKKLAVDAKAGDTEAVAADFKVMGDQCNDCHKGYRAK